MAKGYEAPPGVDIAALRNTKKAAALDLMRPGEGTPWEDRGAQGTLKAFLGTCIRSITTPALLLDHIRRPDTTHEARAFAFGCSALWTIGMILSGVVYNLVYPPAWKANYNQFTGSSYDQQFLIKTAVLGLITAGAAFVLGVMFASRMYFAMVSTELKNNAPRALIYNIFCYCLGPSLLAPIPVIGIPLALLFIFRAWCVAGAKRLYISWRGAIVASVLTFVASLVIAAGVLFLGNTILKGATGLREPSKEEMGEFDPVYGKSR